MGVGRPLDHPFPPQHAQIVVNDAVSAQLSLSSVPEVVVGFCVFELLECVNSITFFKNNLLNDIYYRL